MTNDTTQSVRDKINELNDQAWNTRVNDSLKSFELSKKAVELARTINYPSGLAEGLKSLGFCYIRTANNNEGLPLLQEALALFESLNDLKGQAVVYQYLGIIRRNWGDFGAALELSFKALELSEQTAFKENAAADYYQLGVTYKYLGNFERALDYLYKSLSTYREQNNRLFQSYPISIIGAIYFENGDYTRALEYYQEGLELRQESQDKLGEAGSLDNIGFTYFKLNNYSKAIDYCIRSLEISTSTGDKRSQANAMHHLAEIYKRAGVAVQAARFSNDSLEIRKEIGDKRGEIENLLFLASLHKEQPGSSDKIFNWLNKGLSISEEIKGVDLLSKTHFALYEYYKQEGKFKEAIEHLELHLQLEKELHKNSVNQKIQNLEISHKAEEEKKESEAIRLRNKELNELNDEIREQKNMLEITLADLRSMQAQLIQSEKMASLGELTAGIAHEIQNPLNFVNNFSELNSELLTEMNAEIAKGNYNEVTTIANDVIDNQQKINYHGKRADSIVKGMMQHSRSSSGVKQPIDINALADEYVRLAYHGLRARDKSLSAAQADLRAGHSGFNATIQTDFDPAIDKINVIPQDIGRVILNLVNNAFYAVSEKAKMQSASAYAKASADKFAEASADKPAKALADKFAESLADKYEPTVTITTRKIVDKVELKIRDNGNGVPQKVLDKIFQPFFTTKPTGQGTGLGLSLAYDIVKMHGGEIRIETKEGEFSEFVICLPM